MDIQIAIFDQFHERLHSSLEKYLTMTSSIARTMQGISKEEQAQLQGIGGLDRLCRVYGSSEYLEKKMRDWSDDVFFLELWDELQFRARQNIGSSKTIAGNMSITDVAGRTSSVVGSDEDSGALFDETSAAYRRLRVKTENIIQDTLAYNLRESLRPYGRINPWASLSSEAPPSSLAPSAELDATIQQLSSYLPFLAKALADAPLRRISRQLSLAMQTFLWDYVLLRNSFSAQGAAQFQRDVSAIWDVFDRFVGPGQGHLGMRKLYEALQLLNMPITPDSAEVEGTEDADATPQQKRSLRRIERMVFQDNESARDVLEELGFNDISESDARNILEKRIELQTY